MNWYCDVAPGHEFHGPYHESEYGFPLSEDHKLFERLCLEIMQAGLSWLIILKKKDAFIKAFEQFHIDKVAAYGEIERERLLSDASIIRNKLKINAIIHNAGVIQNLQKEHGSFANWIKSHHPKPKAEWVKLFKKTFKFTGGEITGEFLMSTGYLPGTHREDCPIYKRLEKTNPPWMQVDQSIYKEG
ncbi:DNA-3-methyladenine glycosylase [Candidatus Terasakiella magnetica]|uniref:DNA-3-methyladenine glycosylase n=1 Tax=Candidatus Terasakiella magnetica TaxID=1867952 RepID=A0A1C3RCK2_9PROT|nr:DNA-3-methyladenine glycosylase I [Candidatus Terasakiella magnetica]SCA55007.1 DNA-3-methyladenine glycosylase [Candidatus Terasakiella magnetica]